MDTIIQQLHKVAVASGEVPEIFPGQRQPLDAIVEAIMAVDIHEHKARSTSLQAAGVLRGVRSALAWSIGDLSTVSAKVFGDLLDEMKSHTPSPHLLWALQAAAEAADLLKQASGGADG